MMAEDDVDLSKSKSNIEGIGPVATKVCIVLVSTYFLDTIFCISRGLEAVLY